MELLFSSLPSETGPSDNFHSHSNSNDITSSINYIPELPYEGRNFFQKEWHPTIENELVSNFNSFGRSSPRNIVLKDLLMTSLSSIKEGKYLSEIWVNRFIAKRFASIGH